MSNLSRVVVDRITEDQEIYVGPSYIRITNPPPFGNYQPLFISFPWPKEGNQVGILIQENP